jgi:hypothetical protein
MRLPKHGFEFLDPIGRRWYIGFALGTRALAERSLLGSTSSRGTVGNGRFFANTAHEVLGAGFSEGDAGG